MYRRISHLFFPDPILWVAMVLLAIVLAVWTFFADFTVIYGGDPVIFYLSAAAIAVGVIYHKRSPVMATFGFSFALFMLMSTVLRPISYLGAAEAFPVIDAPLAWFDRLIGFDWVAHVAWVNDNPMVKEVLAGAYSSLINQLVFIFFVLYATQNYERLREFMMVFFGMGIVTTLVATFTPAVGAFDFYKPAADLIDNLTPGTGRYFQEHFLALHNGTMRSVTITDSVGLIAFPSFHTQAAILYIWAVRRTVMFWPFFILNSLMIFSTLTFGGHYVADLLAGIAVTMAVIYAYGVWAGRYRLSFGNLRNNPVADQTGFNPNAPVFAKIKAVLQRRRKVIPT